MRRRSVLAVAALLVTLAALIVGRLSTSTAATTGPAVRVTPKTSPKPVGAVGETFLTKTFTLSHTGGTVKIAGNPGGTAQVEVDDALVFKVKHADGTTSSYSHDYSQGCIGLSGDVPTNPVDISSLFRVGVNRITFSFKDACGGSDATWAMWLTLP
jgi:hypothetical protein